MALRQYANAPATTLAASCTSGAVTIQVVAVTGLPISYPYTLIVDRGLATEEAMSVTAAAGTTLTVTRGIDSTTAFAHSVGANVVHGITAQDLREPNAHINANTSVHGVTSPVVGAEDIQTLTNKTLTLPVISGFNNANHNHTNASGGGQLTDAALSAAVTVAKGGTGVTTLASGNFLQGNGASVVTATKAVPAGDVVGTTDTQTLTNKTVALGSNTVTGTKAQFNTAMTDADFATLDGTEALTNKTLAGAKLGTVGSTVAAMQFGSDPGNAIGAPAVTFTGSISFPAAFAVAPTAVVLTCNASGGSPSICFATTAISTTGFNWIARWVDNSPHSNSGGFSWIAIA